MMKLPRLSRFPRSSAGTPLAILLGTLCAAARADTYTGSVLFPLAAPDNISTYSTATTPQTAALGQVVGTGQDMTTSNNHPLLWSGPSGNPIDLTPTNLVGYTSSMAFGTNGSQQVGSSIGSGTGGNIHALLWSGTPNSAVDLNPLGFQNSFAFATSGSQQVGGGSSPSTGGASHALLWSGTALSFVDLHPASFANAISSQAIAINGGHEAGTALMQLTSGNATYQVYHAFVWSGTAASAIDLNPAGYYQSEAAGVSITQQVGNGQATISDPSHALLWFGTAASVVDLNPAGFNTTFAVATNGINQIGYGFGTATGGDSHALLWSGSAASVVDLQNFLPAGGTWFDSNPYTFDSAGNIYGTADGIYNGARGTFAVTWTLASSTAAAIWDGSIGNWSAANHWSTNPNFPNNGMPSGSSYAAVINAGTVNLDLSVKLSSLTINGGGMLDIHLQALVIQATDASDKQAKINQLNNLISQGFNGGTWTGNGITSSTAAGNPTHLAIGVFDNAILMRSLPGLSTDASSLILGVAHIGDANGSGIVDIQDQSLVTNNWQQPNSTWTGGDLNRDGFVDIQDLTLVTNNWQQSFEPAALAGGALGPIYRRPRTRRRSLPISSNSPPASCAEAPAPRFFTHLATTVRLPQAPVAPSPQPYTRRSPSARALRHWPAA